MSQSYGRDRGSVIGSSMSIFQNLWEHSTLANSECTTLDRNVELALTLRRRIRQSATMAFRFFEVHGR